MAFSKNLCSKHYQQAENPLKIIWKQLRSRCKGGYPPEWDDFETFVSQLSERPSRLHQLRRPDPTKAWSLDNMVWRDPIVGNRQYRTREEKAEYGKIWNLRKKYGITPAIYQQMHAAQGGVCAICKKVETRRHRTTRKPLDLVVDHCHQTGAVRGLLCSNCNGGLGSFDDDLARLRAAIAYLEHHAGLSNARPEIYGDEIINSGVSNGEQRAARSQGKEEAKEGREGEAAQARGAQSLN